MQTVEEILSIARRRGYIDSYVPKPDASSDVPKTYTPEEVDRMERDADADGRRGGIHVVHVKDPANGATYFRQVFD